MQHQKSPDTFLFVGFLATAVFLAAFGLLYVLGGYGLSAAVFLALLVSVIAWIVLYIGMNPSKRGGDMGTARAPAPTVPRSAPAAPAAPAAAAAEPAGHTVAEPEPEPDAPAEPPQPEAHTAAEAPAEPAAVEPSAEAPPDSDKPKGLDGPRDGKADDLKQIKGVGPKMEDMLNGMGYYHFDQIANWTDKEVAWVDANLEGFKGRVSRDEWVSQAKTLASGGSTEFSKRVDDGDVY